MAETHKKSKLAKKFVKAAGVVILSAAALAMSVPHLSGIFNKSAKAVTPENKIERVEEVTQQRAPESIVLEQKHDNEKAKALGLYRDFLGVLIDASNKGELGLSDEAMEDIEHFHDKLSHMDLNNLTEKQIKAIDTITDSFASTSYYGEIPLPETLMAERQARLAEKQAKADHKTGHIEQKVTSYTTVGGNLTSFQSKTVSGDIDGNGNVTNVKSTSTSLPSPK